MKEQVLVNWEFYENETKVEKNDHRFPWTGCVYAYEYGDCLKIGSTKSPRSRLFALAQQAKKVGIKTGAVVLSLRHEKYRESERSLHHIFSTFRHKGSELFDITVGDFLDNIELIEKTIDFEDKPRDKRFDMFLHSIFEAHT